MPENRLYLKFIGLSGLLFVFLAGCKSNTSILTPNGPAANRITEIWWFLFISATIIFVFVLSLIAIAVLQKPDNHDGTKDADPNSGSFMGNLRFVIITGVVIPGVTLAGVLIVAIGGMQSLWLPQEVFPFTIEVTGHQFWWEVHYPDHNFTTANELYIPINEPIRIVLHTEDVIHSFWVPELQGKMDMIPGQTNETWIEATAVGQYEGICTEFCGLQHANMRFFVLAKNHDEFEQWVAQQQQPAVEPQTEVIKAGQGIFFEEGNCANCHTISGTLASGDSGPNLTHFASRLTIGAGAVPNIEGHLSGWIIDSQSIKPGSLMPPIPLSGQELEALVAYLYTLK